MADTYVKGRLKKTLDGGMEYRLPRTSLDNIVANASSATTYIASDNLKIKAAYLTSATGGYAGIIYNNDTSRLNINNGGISIKAQTDIASATTDAELAKVPTTSAVKEYVSAVAGTGHFLDVIAKSSASSSTLIADSTFKIKPEYLTSATETSAGVVYNNDTARLTITSGGISVNAQTNITGATTTAELSKVPTTSAVKDYVSSYVEEHAGTDVLGGVLMPDYTHMQEIDIQYEGGTAHNYTTDPENPHNYTPIGTDYGLGGWIIGNVMFERSVQAATWLTVELGDDLTSGANRIPVHYYDIHDDGRYTADVPLFVPLPPNVNFRIVATSGMSGIHGWYYYVPNIGYAIPNSEIQYATISDN